MARQYISLVSDEEKRVLDLKTKIMNGEITAENFHSLSPEDQKEANNVLFELSAAGVNIHQGVSSLEFILCAFMRITNKKVAGMSLSEDEKEMEAALQRIMELHEIANPQIRKDEWLFDYLGYAEKKTAEILQNRKAHVDRKKHTTGRI